MVAKEETNEGVLFSELRPHEVFWVDLYEFLKTEGFQLRPRYQPGFKATFTSGEPALVVSDENVMDAIEISGSKKVCLKYMSPSETVQTRELSWQRKNEPGNHAVPIEELISVGEDGYCIAVLPFLREFDDPPFLTVGEVVEAVGQFLEGIEFIHAKNVAHRDACFGNMMMDASQLIPNGWHMVRPWTEDGTKLITSVPRSSVSVKYYFIDFGLSVSVDPSKPVATGVVGQDRTVPEFKAAPDAEYNPFKLDIYQLGNTFKDRLLDRYQGLDFLSPLITAMTQDEPEKRPTASEAREMFTHSTQDVALDASVTLKPKPSKQSGDPPVQASRSMKAEAAKKVATLKMWLTEAYARIRRLLRRS